MIYTDNLDHKPAAVELERLPDGTAWLRLYKDIKEVSEETTQNGESYTSKHWEATCAACKLGADRAGETVKTEAWEEQPPMTVAQRLDAVETVLADMAELMMGGTE